MKPRMISSQNDRKVFRPVVKRVFIYVMHNFFGQKLSADLFFGNDSVFVSPHFGVVDFDFPVNVATRVVEPCRPNGVGYPNLIKNPYFVCFFGSVEHLALALTASLRVMKTFSVFPANTGNFRSTDFARFFVNWFAHDASYA